MQISISRPVSQIIKISEPTEQTITVSKPVDRVVKVATGVPGIDGKSAYQVAVDAGFEGSEAEWLDSLIGTSVTGGEGPPVADGLKDAQTYLDVSNGDVYLWLESAWWPLGSIASDVPGPPTNIEIGDVETLPSGEEAYLRMRGTAPNLILDAGLVSGADGSGGGDSQIYGRVMWNPADMGEGWEAYLYLVRTGNIVTLVVQGYAVEGVATPIITDKIPEGYRAGMQAFASAFSLDESTGALTDTTLVWATEDTLSFLLEENPAGMYYTATMVYFTFDDDPPESDAMETYNLNML